MKLPIFCVLSVLSVLCPAAIDAGYVPVLAPPLLNPGGLKNGSVDVVGYLFEFEYLTDTQTNIYKALRQLQRDKYLRVTGSVTAETVFFIEEEVKQNNAILYLRKCKFLEGIESPRNIRVAISKFQEITRLVQTGTFTEATLNFIEQNPDECST